LFSPDRPLTSLSASCALRVVFSACTQQPRLMGQHQKNEVASVREFLGLQGAGASTVSGCSYGILAQGGLPHCKLVQGAGR
jgi:hypothetical protein